MPSKNTSIALNLLALSAGMLMLAYASVPLYKLFCAVTGYGGTTKQGTYSNITSAHKPMTVSFNADIDPALPWIFKPGEHEKKITIGEQSFTHYVAENLTDNPITGRAVYNVVPFAAGQYFVKVECFCFTEQTLAAKTRVDMPILFYIDPKILDDPDLKNIQTITLSYTFFPVKTEPTKN